MTDDTNSYRAWADAWCQHPCIETLLERLRDAPDACQLAVHLYGRCDVAELPSDIVYLILDAAQEDPLLEACVDALVEVASDLDCADMSGLAAQVTTAVVQQPERVGMALVLIETLTDLVYDDEATDGVSAAVLERFTVVSAEVADHLDFPQAAGLVLARAMLRTDDVEKVAELARCWELAAGLDSAMRLLIGQDVVGLGCDVAPQLVVTATETLLRDAAESAPDDVEVVEHLWATRAVALQLSGSSPIWATLSFALTGDPRLIGTDLREHWFEDCSAGLCAIYKAEDRTRSALVEIVEDLQRHRNWWVESDVDSTATLMMLIARVWLELDQTQRAVEWLDDAERMPVADDVVLAALAMCRVGVAYRQGRAAETAESLRRAAPLLDAADDIGLKLEWAMLSQVVGEAFRDAAGADAAARLVVSLAEEATEAELQELGPTTAADLLDLNDRATAVTRIAHRIHDTQTITAEDLNHISVLYQGISPQSPVFLVALALHAQMELVAGSQERGWELLERLRAGMDQQRDSSMAVPMVGLQTVAAFTGVLGGLQGHHMDDEECRRQLVVLRQLRDDHIQNGRAFLAYSCSRMAAVLETKLGNTRAAIDEGIDALGLHTGRSLGIPSAQERAAMRDELSTLLKDLVQLALRLRDVRLVAEILEIARAQPIPIAPLDTNHSQHSLRHLGVRLLESINPKPLHDWGVPFLVEEVATASALPESPIDESVLLLAGIPAVRLPWGFALANRLRDPSSTVSAAVDVHRGDVDPST